MERELIIKITYSSAITCRLDDFLLKIITIMKKYGCSVAEYTIVHRLF